MPNDRANFELGSSAPQHAHTTGPTIAAVLSYHPTALKMGTALTDNNKQKRKKHVSQSSYEHNCRCHLPHDPQNCEACLRARLMAKKNTSNDDWGDIAYKDNLLDYKLSVFINKIFKKIFQLKF